MKKKNEGGVSMDENFALKNEIPFFFKEGCR